MDNKPPLDRSILIPIFIGFASLLGICLVLFVARFSAVRATVQAGESRTPVKYQYLATEPGIAIPTEAPPATSVSETDTPAPVSTLIDFPPTFISTSISTQAILPGVTNTLVTVSPTPLVLSITYDDVDIRFNYTGNWVGQSGVSGADRNTLHISNTIGDAVQLSFVGQKIRIVYQAGPSLGTIKIKLDGVDFTLDQFALATLRSEWESPVLVLSSHTLTITHISGGSINLDAIAVLDISTPTPTSTPTSTATATP